jgi:hypothetical protein
MEHPLKRAFAASGIGADEVASRLQVDPKTVRRWCGGRIPYPRHRNALSELTGWTVHDIWPGQIPVIGRSDATADMRVVEAKDLATVNRAYRQLLEPARISIGILATSDRFKDQAVELAPLLLRKAHNGARVQVLLSGPAAALGSLDETAVAVRYNDHADLYHSIYYADSDILISPKVYGVFSPKSSLFHLRRLSDSDMADMYFKSFDRLWDESHTRRSCH